MCMICVVFFFEQKTAYEMRISDWSSDLCSSDLGTFSDGKLYSQIRDPKHHGRKVIDELVKAGAPEEIAYVSKPHIGTFRLVGIVENLRQTITALGGEKIGRAHV